MAKKLELSPAVVEFSVERGELLAKEGNFFLEKRYLIINERPALRLAMEGNSLVLMVDKK